MEDSKHDDSHSVDADQFRTADLKLLNDLQALLSCSIPRELLLSMLQSEMLSHSNQDMHRSISHLLISYPGKRGKIANATILPLDLCQVTILNVLSLCMFPLSHSQFMLSLKIKRRSCGIYSEAQWLSSIALNTRRSRIWCPN